MQEIINSRVLNTMLLLEKDYKERWSGCAPPVAFSVRDIAGGVFGNDLVREIPNPLLTLLVFNEMKDLSQKGLLRKIDDPENYSHYTQGPKTEFYVIM